MLALFFHVYHITENRFVHIFEENKSDACLALPDGCSGTLVVGRVFAVVTKVFWVVVMLFWIVAL